MTGENGFSIRETEALKREIFASLHCALPGIVESFDEENGTATVRPAVKREGLVFPLLHDVPVFMPVSFEVNSGDLCLLVFADCDIDRWFETGETGEPASGRMHSLSDAFGFVGFGVERRGRFSSSGRTRNGENRPLVPQGGDDGGGAAD